MSRFLSARLSTLEPYTPGEQPGGRPFIKLNTNESPYPPAPGVIEAITGAAATLNLYSDPASRALEDAIAARYGVSPEQVIAGNGSDEILAFCFQAFCDAQKGVRFPDITYGFYPVYARLYGVPADIIPLDGDLRVRPEDYCRAGRTVVLANPNAPTGIVLSRAEVERIVRENPDNLVIIDEAYVDFGGESAVPLIDRYDNLLVVMTFSKSRNLAGARLGFALGQRALIDDLRRIKFSFNPYNVNRLSQLAGAAAMRDESYFTDCIGKIIAARRFAADALSSRGFTVTDSRANFLFVSPPDGGGEAYCAGLRARGILVRHFKAPRTCGFVRVTVGTMEQMRAVIKATDEYLEEA